tara:strand:- start:630 stop:773 length:144 start_codon:yes stop_codon:yes gene_type:complete
MLAAATPSPIQARMENPKMTERLNKIMAAPPNVEASLALLTNQFFAL